MKYEMKQEKHERNYKKSLASAGLALAIGVSSICSGCASITGRIENPEINRIYKQNGKLMYKDKAGDYEVELREVRPWYLSSETICFAGGFIAGAGLEALLNGSKGGKDSTSSATATVPAATTGTGGGGSYTPSTTTSTQPAQTSGGNTSGGTTPPASSGNNFEETTSKFLRGFRFSF